LGKQHNSENDEEAVEVDDDDFLNTHLHTNTSASTSSLLLGWKKTTEYYQTRKILNETNCESYKYLVLRCLMRNKSVREHRIVCSIPTAIRLASDGGRLLFIQWERPALLEEFLLPPGKLD
jgi:hypothetical protein